MSLERRYMCVEQGWAQRSSNKSNDRETTPLLWSVLSKTGVIRTCPWLAPVRPTGPRRKTNISWLEELSQPPNASRHRKIYSRADLSLRRPSSYSANSAMRQMLLHNFKRRINVAIRPCPCNGNIITLVLLLGGQPAMQKSNRLRQAHRVHGCVVDELIPQAPDNKNEQLACLGCTDPATADSTRA